jgi:hypothetical protein
MAYEMQTKETGARVEDFLNAVEDEQKRADAFAAAAMMLKYPDGREIDWMKIAFSPRKAGLTIYLHSPMDYGADLFAKLGKHTTSVACLYIRRLRDVDQEVLKELIALSLKQT